MKYLNILLQRNDPSVPWGFRLNGGQGFGTPLTIKQVMPGTIASNHLGCGDVIIKIGKQDALRLDHMEANDVIHAYGDVLELLVLKRPQSNPGTPNAPGTPGTPCFTPPPPIQANVWSPKRAPFPTSPSQGPFSKGAPPISSSMSNSPTFQPSQFNPPSCWSPTANASQVSPRPGSIPVFPTSQNASPVRTTPMAPAPPPPPPPPPPPMPSQITAVPWRQKAKQNGESHQRSNSHSPYCQQDGSANTLDVGQYENLPAALHGTLQKDKKPFTYTPGGIDFSEIRSPRMQRRIDKNASVQAQGGQPVNQNYYHNNNNSETPDQGMPQSRSFRVLQAITADNVGADSDTPRQLPKPTEDEMRFKGLRHAPVPSKAFHTLQKMTGEQNEAQPYEQHHYPQVCVAPAMNRGQRQKATRVTIPVEQQYPDQQDGYYYPNPSVPASQQPSEAEPKKYMGGHIPSRSFRMLQAMTGGEEDDSYVPETNEAPAELVPQQGEVKMYTGGHIPSRSFRILQAMTGEDGTANGAENGVTDF